MWKSRWSWLCAINGCVRISVLCANRIQIGAMWRHQCFVRTRIFVGVTYFVEEFVDKAMWVKSQTVWVICCVYTWLNWLSGNLLGLCGNGEICYVISTQCRRVLNCFIRRCWKLQSSGSTHCKWSMLCQLKSNVMSWKNGIVQLEWECWRYLFICAIWTLHREKTDY